MSAKPTQARIYLSIGLIALLALILTGCNMPASKDTPATPTVPLTIPVITAGPTNAAADDADDDIEVIEEETEEADEAPAPTETAMPQEADSADEAEETESDSTADPAQAATATTAPTATVIPYITTENGDPMVMFYGSTTCYAEADSDSAVLGTAPSGTALAAFKRDWNWYLVVHPTTGGMVCWVTGDTIRPNQSAFNLGN